MKGKSMTTKNKAEIQGQTVVCLKTKTSSFDGKELAIAMERLNAKCKHEHEWVAMPDLATELTVDPVPALRGELDRLRIKIKGQLQELEAKDRLISSMKTEIENLRNPKPAQNEDAK